MTVSYFELTISILPSLYIFGLTLLRALSCETNIKEKSFIVNLLLALGFLFMQTQVDFPEVNHLCWNFSFIYAILSYYYLVRGKKYDESISLKGKVVIITGANSGIGLETANGLAKLGAFVILGCRDKTRGLSAVNYIKENCGHDAVECIPLDLSDLSNIRRFVAEFKSRNLPLHTLINNAGVIMTERRVTVDNIELTMSANYFGHFLLTNLLLDDLKKQKDARIINIGSCLHQKLTSFPIDDLMLEKSFDAFKAYNLSKMAQLLFTRELSTQLKGTDVTVNYIHPGLVLTDVARNMPWIVRVAYTLVKPIAYLFQKTCSQGAYTSIYAASSPAMVGVTGQYLMHCAIAQPNALANDKKLCQELWKRSIKIVQL